MNQDIPADRPTYERYLKIPELLELQKPLAEPESHDEMLFIISHQVFELWFRLMLHELRLILSLLDEGEIREPERLLRRLTATVRLFIPKLTVLETMIPSDFIEFRDNLKPASGFQSVRGIVRARLAARPTAAQVPLWTALAPIAVVLAIAGFVLLTGGPGLVPVTTVPETGLVLSVSSIEDMSRSVFTIDGGQPEQVYHMAVSSSSDFRQAELFEFHDGRWVDSTAVPPAGQAYFYRVD